MRTFTKTLMAFALIGFLMTSCGGGSEVCGCADTALAMMKEAKDTKMDPEKIKAIQEKYKEKLDKCEKILRPESEEARKKAEEELKNCPASKEAEKLMMGGE
jgi:hypothetical protein